MRYSDGGYNVVAMGDLSKFARIQQKLGYIFDPNLKPGLTRKKKKTDQLKPGYHNAHKKAFSKSKEETEDTLPLPGVKNCSLGVLDLYIEEDFNTISSGI